MGETEYEAFVAQRRDWSLLAYLYWCKDIEIGVTKRGIGYRAVGEIQLSLMMTYSMYTLTQ